MGDVVTITTFREFYHHSRGMRDAMTALACRDRFVLSGVTGYARQALMLGVARFQQAGGLLMADRTVCIGGSVAKGYDFWHVSFVAFPAIRLGHGLCVWFMALHAERGYPMDVMAGRAEEVRMFAFVVPKLLDLRGMTGETRPGDVVAE